MRQKNRDRSCVFNPSNPVWSSSIIICIPPSSLLNQDWNREGVVRIYFLKWKHFFIKSSLEPVCSIHWSTITFALMLEAFIGFFYLHHWKPLFLVLRPLHGTCPDPGSEAMALNKASLCDPQLSQLHFADQSVHVLFYSKDWGNYLYFKSLVLSILVNWIIYYIFIFDILLVISLLKNYNMDFSDTRKISMYIMDFTKM